MNDFAVDEKLLKEVRDLCGPLIKEEFPEKLKKVPVTVTSLKISENAMHKKEKNEIETKLKNLEKNFTKVSKKNSDLSEEVRILKSLNESMKKELNVLSLANEKILNEKLGVDKLNEENKNYIRKLEARLLQGAKNQHLIEINNKLREEIKELKVTISHYKGNS